MAPSLYLLKQNAWRYNHGADMASLQGYLKITEDKVYLDEEVDKVEDIDHNGEFFAVDFVKGYIWTF
jgi:hypothetical protein